MAALTKAELAEALEPLLIENRSIFGAKKAAALMQQMYAEEINLLAMRQREWARIGGSDADAAAAAQKAMTTLRELDPTLRISTLDNWFPFSSAEDMRHLAEGLRKAGLPE